MSAASGLDGCIHLKYEESKLKNGDGTFKTRTLRLRYPAIWFWALIISASIVFIVIVFHRGFIEPALVDDSTMITTEHSNLLPKDAHTIRTNDSVGKPGYNSIVKTSTEHSVHPSKDTGRIDINSCGGIIFVHKNTTSYITFPQGMGGTAMSCIWIIKSETKMINIQLVSYKFYFPQDGFVIGELSIGDEELKCRKMVTESLRNMVKTPAILQFTSPSTYSGFQVGLSPVSSSGTHESQPLTYYVDQKQPASVIASNMRPESLLALMAVFPGTDSRRRIFECNSADMKKCSDFIVAYNIESFESGGACTKVPLLGTSPYICASCRGKARPLGDKTKVVLSRAHGTSHNQAFRLNWKTV